MVLGAGLLLVGPAAAQVPPVLRVGVASAACPAPTHPTLVAAVAAAAPGSTILVCPGVYPGTVVVDKPLILRGAQRGVDARAGRSNVAAESVIDGGGAAGIRITGTTSGVTVDGFTIRNAGTSTQNADGIEAFSGGSGFTFTDNVVTQTTYGITMSSTGAVASTVAHNRFDTNNRSGAAGGSGVFVCCGPGNNLTIADNLFTGHSSAAVNTAGDAARPSTGLRIERNQSIDDATFAVVVNAKAAVVADNVVVRRPGAVVDAGSGIYVGGGTTSLQVTRNVISAGAATGIRVTNVYGAPNVGLAVVGNQVIDRQYGVRLSGQTSGTVRDNSIARSTTVGILLDADNAGVTVTGNRIGQDPLDCQDRSTGTRTAGTANTWTGNVALRSLPVGLCGRF
ncbi:MAG: right-handed parallel beta-helix repeat-containing protein [Pseudonocardia sp.]|nr:right-handed parallel beta-helix repeat-containing protein [Pseudonocardia sp.]